jgi:zinc-binding alcohol dehydrogenase/oxidoreductase
MKALVLNEVGQLLEYKDVPNPVEKDDSIVVKVRAGALNHRDVWITKGMYPGIKPNIILGSDGVGIYNDQEVIINPNHNWGDNPKVQGKDYHILGLPTNGTFAEEVLVHKSKICLKPRHLSSEEAATLPLGGMTAYRALFTKCQLRKGERVLISGVGGGVALFAFQFAVAAGAEVWVTSGAEWKIDKAMKMGAAGGVSYKDADWKAFGKKTGGFDVIIDSAGGDGFSNLVKLANPGGRMCFYGGTRGKISSLNPQLIFWKQLSIFGSTMGTDEEFMDMVDFVDEHGIVPVIDSVYQLKNGNDAFMRMHKGLQFGKIVLKVS